MFGDRIELNVGAAVDMAGVGVVHQVTQIDPSTLRSGQQRTVVGKVNLGVP